MDLMCNGRGKVLLSTVSSDSHTWNLVFFQLLLEEEGYQVVNLGPCVPDKLFVSALIDHNPDAVVISTVNGHGWADGERVVRRLRAVDGAASVPVVIGGKVGIHGAGNSRHTADLLAAGFTEVFTDRTAPQEFLARLRDLVDRHRMVAVTGEAA